MVVLACGDIDSRNVGWYRWGTRPGRRLFPRVPHGWDRHFVGTVDDWDLYHHLGTDDRYVHEADHHLDTDDRNGDSKDQSNFVTIAIDDTDDDQITQSNDGYWIRKLHLTITDKEELLNGEMLSDKHILAAQRILQRQFPHIAGLQDPCLSQTGFQPVEGDSVQIHHTRGSHWVVSSWCQGDIVEVYDTLYDDVTPDLLRQLDEIYVNAPRDSQGNVLYTVCDVAKQRGYRDCGLFAIALAFELCQGFDVREVTFKQRLMRHHLAKCFEQQCIERFPMF